MSLTATMLVCLDHLWQEFDKLDLPMEHECRKTFAAMVAAMHLDADSVSNDWLDRYPQVTFYYVFTRTNTGKYELKKRNFENGQATTSSTDRVL